MSLLTAKGSGRTKARNFTSKMVALISLLSERGITIVPGSSPATDGVSKVYMPWLPDDATEEQYLKFFVSAAHEQAHFHGESDVKRMPKNKFKHFCVNAVDDIRCERLQELAYPGLVEYRAKEYGIDCEGFLKEEFMEASKDNLKGLIIAAIKYMIVLNRVHQMGVEAEVPVYASADLIEVYREYLQDLEPTLDKIETFDESMKVGEEVYNRLHDLVKDELTPPPPPEKSEDSEESDGGEPDDSEESDGDGSDDSEESEDSDKSSSKSSKSDDSEESEGEESDGEGSDDSEGDEPEDSGKGSKSDGGEPEESDGDESEGDTSGDDGEDAEPESDPVGDFMDELEEGDEDMVTVADSYKSDVSKIMKEYPGAYLSVNGIKDRLEYGYESKDVGYGYLTRGKALLGTAGHKMTQLFVSQTRDRMLYAQRGGRIDMRTLVCDPMDSRQDVYTRKIHGSLEKSAVSFAIDNSGSMATGGRIHRAYEILAGVLYYLDKAGIPTEAMGFTAETNHRSNLRDAPVTHTIIKEFHEQFKCKAVSRCHPPARLAQNIELEALRFLAPRLMMRPERKILFVLSDGEPQFGVHEMNKRMSVAYTAYIKKLRTLGIVVFGFGIDCDLTEFFGEHCINTSTGNIGQEIVKKLTEILNK